jgi:hypothetical protein
MQSTNQKNHSSDTGYKYTEVGVIPEDWEVRRLKEFFTIKSGFAFSSTYFSKKARFCLHQAISS